VNVVAMLTTAGRFSKYEEYAGKLLSELPQGLHSRWKKQETAGWILSN